MQTAPLWQLAGRHCAIALEPVEGSPPLWRHFGPVLASADADADADADARSWPLAGARPLPPNSLDGDPALSVMPTHGLGWFHHPGLAGSRPGEPDGTGSDWLQQFALERVEHGGQTLSLHLRDELAALALTLYYRLDPATDVITAEAELHNLGSTPFRVDWLAAACVPLPPEANQVIGFAGRWTLEYQQARETLGVASWRQESRRGRNGHDSFPAVIVGPTLADDHGPAWGAHLAWSGNHCLLIEPLSDGRRQLQLGEWFAPGEMLLAPGERYRTPQACLSFSPAGLDGLAANFHRHVRQQVLQWPDGRMAPRPVHLNTWEAVYFDHDLPGLKALASAGAALGVERFVLDDGWFHRRRDDRAALGDWWADEKKYPDGLQPLVDHVRGLGLQFGLWVEPEMVNPDSELYRAHPSWALGAAGRPLVLGRNQLVLDLSQEGVLDHLFGKLDTLLRRHEIGYLKWDMNRDLATASLGQRGRAAYHRHTQAFYALLARLRAAHPTVEIESCASGGGRADMGVLRHTHRVWTSDCNDALARIEIQSGFLRFLPPEVMGAHIGPARSHTTGRSHDLAFRASVAMFGHLGLEQDVRLLDPDERSALAGWIAHYKAWREVVHHGVLRQSRLGGLTTWQATAPDAGAALVALFRHHEEPARYTPPLRVTGLHAGHRYRLQALHLPGVPHARTGTGAIAALADGTLELGGAELRELGIALPALPPESAIVIGIRRAA